ncbi:acyl-CoA dehydrogenase [Pedobacter sp. MC2016-14]|uniref:acyl-CoA dehydrogenase n=1 Tax=Pedobacter sp. MC2016-14 TaxID=2897327 RepID=UPI001E5B9F37|nr:acyl-CoA dehydrogenase [Pedobacter sp. MC2016-14]MCD0487880.1 acyl-CoA dehydrogenase [Pedobacter sp. MC2016-14]
MSITITNSVFSTFIENFRTNLKQLFHQTYNIDELSAERGLPADLLDGIMKMRPLSVAIPEEYGGRGVIVKECLSVLAAASYESLPLSLTFGINIALFLEPLSKYGDSSVKMGVFSRFLENQNMGGLMITEPNYGSDALNMKTSNKLTPDGYHIKGTKHWQGLTGMADYWLIASRKENDNGELGRDIDFFLCDNTLPGQQIKVTEYYDNPGLLMIPYGLNELDIVVPEYHKLKPESTGIKMMLDILHRSRLQFPGMGMGFIHRMLDEAVQHCNNRIVGGSNLLAMDNVQFQITRLQSAYTICSAMCARSSAISGIDHSLAAEGLEANAMKAVVTDLMQESAQLLVQLSGANGYRTSHIGGRGIMDSRPFQIFEGSNEMLYAQIADMVLRAMKKEKQSHLYEFLKLFKPTARASAHFQNDLSFTISTEIPQRKLVDLGKALARVVCAGYVLELEDKGFRKDLAEHSILSLKQEVATLICAFQFDNTITTVKDYLDGSAWFDFV